MVDAGGMERVRVLRAESFNAKGVVDGMLVAVRCGYA